MRTLLFLIAAAGGAILVAAGPGFAQTAADSAAIREASLDYIEGWYTGDASRMERALHPELVKRIVNTHPRTGSKLVSTMGASQLVAATGAGGGVEAERKRTDVVILDVFEGVATVRVDAGDWIDYLQLVRWNDRWVILNVLWALRPEAQ
jgi:hypothetical protein